MFARRTLPMGALAFAGCLAAASPAFAHAGHLGREFSDGWAHPFGGLDHLLAMVAVGLLAVRIGGRSVYGLCR